MQFGWLVIRNFARVQEIRIDLSGQSLTQVIGNNEDTGKSNESGKTTIFNALSWCLFGRYPTSRANVGDDIVNPITKKNCEVTQEILDDDNTRYTIMRTRRHKDFKNSIIIGECPYGGAVNQMEYDLSNSDGNDRIVQILGMDYDTFVRAHYFAQEGIVPFGRMTDAKLKEFFLENLIDLAWVRDAHTSVKESMGYLEVHLMDNKSKLMRLESSIQDKENRIEELKQKHVQWEEDCLKEIEGYQYEISELKGSIDVIEERKEAVEKKIGELRSAITSFDVGTDWSVVFNKAQQKHKELVSLVGGLEYQVKKAKENYETSIIQSEATESLVGTQCDKCGNSITAANLPYINKELLRLVREAKKSYEAVAPQYSESSQEMKALESEMEGLKTKIQEYNDNRLKIKDWENSANQLEMMIDISQIEKNILHYENEIEKKKQAMSPYTAMMQQERERIESDSNEMKEVECAIVKIEHELQLNTFWLKAFSSQGIQSYVLDSVTQVLNKLIAEYLMHLSDGRISARLTTVKMNKSGEYRDNFGVEIFNMDGGDTYASLSGGAKKRVDLAISLAISRFVMALQGKELKFIVFDEATTGMDDHWTSKFIEMIIEKFRGYSTWYITHQPIDFFYFDNVITVVKQNGETKIKES